LSRSMTASEIAQRLGGTLRGDGGRVIRDVAKIEEAGPTDLSFIANVKYVRYLDETRAGALLVTTGMKAEGRTLIEVADPYLGFMRMLDWFHPRAAWLKVGVHPSAVIEADAVVAPDASIGAFCYVGPRAVIGARSQLYPQVVICADAVVGEDCEIHSRVTLREGVRLGNRVVVQDGAVLGSDGFGFAQIESGYVKIPQRGIVIIGDDVEIGANTTVDRATLGETSIGTGTKLDNLIQVAHNVTVGSHTVIAAQTGISGSARVGDRCRIGGQVGIVGHLSVGDGVMIGAQSGVGGNVEPGEVVSGSPSRPHALWKRIEASLTRLPELFRRVRALEAAVFVPKNKEKGSS
jgi:UDP-3-O-[3-hydroxymyristoyl] glucosamine N-acyltransferase